MKMNEKLLCAVTSIEAGQSTYVQADLNEVRKFIGKMDNFICAPIGHGQVKITKLKAERQSLNSTIRKALEAFSGQAVLLNDVDGQQVRNAVSRYNRENRTQFAVMKVSDYAFEISTDSIEDYGIVSMEQYSEFRASMMKRVDRVFAKVRHEDEVMEVEFDDDEEGEIMGGGAPMPKMEIVQPTPAHTPQRDPNMTACVRCGDEFYKQGPSNVCGDCMDEDLV